MAKYYGKIGYALTMETAPGVWTDDITEKVYFGDIIKNGRKWSNNPDSINDNLTITNQISILADSFANNNVGAMKYITFTGAKWKITNVDIDYPRLTLTTGDLYNEE